MVNTPVMHAQVYDRCMARSRTNIEIEDDLVEVVMTRYAVRTKTEAVDLALRHLAGQPMSRDEALSMRGARAMEQVPEDHAPRGAA
jgi:Arc/MetJ family transcription regulator